MICHICGKRLANILGKRVEGVPITIGGVELRAHLVCAEGEGLLPKPRPKNGRLPMRESIPGASS